MRYMIFAIVLTVAATCIIGFLVFMFLWDYLENRTTKQQKYINAQVEIAQRSIDYNFERAKRAIREP